MTSSGVSRAGTVGPVSTPTRGARRRTATRAALVAAARGLLADHAPAEVSIQSVTDAADVGFGSFYNHFESKTELFEVVVAEVLEEHGVLLDAVAGTLDDPAAVVAVSLRTSGRLALLSPETARILLRSGLAVVSAPTGLAPRALRNLRDGMAAGRFTAGDPRTAQVVIGGGLLGVLSAHLDSPAAELEAAVDELAELALRMLGLDPAEAAAIAHAPLPAVDWLAR